MIRALAFSGISIGALYVGVVKPLGGFYEWWSSSLVIAIRQALSLGS